MSTTPAIVERMEPRRLLTTIDLAALGTDGSTFIGVDSIDQSGFSVDTAGDVNGDGFDDFIISSRNADGVGNASQDAGECYVVFGWPTLPESMNLEGMGVLGFTIVGAGAYDASGDSVSGAGDVNGDGFDDLLIGAPGLDRDAGLNSEAGGAYVLFGSNSLGGTIELSNLGSGGVTFLGRDFADFAGYDISNAGDVNGDGFEDMLISASWADGSDNLTNQVGETYLVFGGESLPSTIDLRNLGTAGVTFYGIDEQDYSGSSVSSAGDINGDGLDDMLIGAWNAQGEYNQLMSTGEVYVLFGTRSFPETVELDNSGSFNMRIIQGSAPFQNVGLYVSAAGDVNGDGFDDFLISSTFDPDENSNGTCYLIYGRGFPSTAAHQGFDIDLSNLGSDGVVFTGAETYDYASVVSGGGDINGDGFDDLIIHAGGADGTDNLKPYSGEGYVIFGSAALPDTVSLGAVGSVGVTILGPETFGTFVRSSLSLAGDVNGDGFDDLLIGYRYVDDESSMEMDVGKSYLIYGRDFSSAVTDLGTDNAEHLFGSAGADVMVAGGADDVLLGNGGADSLRGGEGDDLFFVDDTAFFRVVGGNGIDTLSLNAAGQTLNLTTLGDNRLVDLEQIDITGFGNNGLLVNFLEVLNISSTSNTLVIQGDAGDRIGLDSGWTRGTDETIGDDSFRVYTRDAATLKVNTLVTVQTPTTIELSHLGAGGTTLFGEDVQDLSGYSVSDAGDVNGDGFDDFVIGAIFGAAVDNLKEFAGDTYVVFGGPSLPATIDLGNLGSQGIVISGAEADDTSGISVSAAGDVNGDGFDDLVIGADGADGPENARYDAAGESYLIFGGASLPSTMDLANLGANGITIFGAAAYDASGRSVSNAGDVNGDGFDDLLIGAYSVEKSYLVFGAETLPATIDLATLGSAGMTIESTADFVFLGFAVSTAGDVNGDGFDDLIIGAPFSPVGDGTVMIGGKSAIIFGAASLPETIDVASLGSAGVTIIGVDEGDRSGRAVSTAGDVNGDGFDDVIVGAWQADGAGNAKDDAGDSYLILGGTSLPEEIHLETLGSAGITFHGADPNDLLGFSVSTAGDLNGDGYDDLIMGAYRSKGVVNESFSAGGAYVVFGGSALPEALDMEDLAFQGIAIHGIDVNDQAGVSVSTAGDVNGDGFDDILIGAFLSYGRDNEVESTGETYLIYGGDFSASVTHAGTNAAETLTGTAARDVMVGGRENDSLIANGGLDILRGGQGDDEFEVVGTSFGRMVGGNGLDTLRLSGANQNLNLTTLADNRLVDIEQIDITGSGSNTLTLNQFEVLNLSSHSNTVVVRRNAGDVVNRGTGWTQTTPETIAGVTYEVFTQGAATLKIENVAPQINAFDATVRFIENGSPIPLDADAVVVDDSPHFNGGVLIVRLTENAQSTDHLEVRHQGAGPGQIGVNGANVTFGGTTIGTLTGGIGGADLVVTLNENATPLATSLLIRNITFRTATEAPVTMPRTVQVSLTDGVSGTGIQSTKTINVAAVNDAPVLAGATASSQLTYEPPALNYTENGPGVSVSSTLTVLDADLQNLTGARLRIAQNYQRGADQLVFTNTATISATWDAVYGVLVLTGTDTVANYQAAMRNIKFRNTSDNPSTQPREVYMLVNDGIINSNVVAKVINVTATNDAPVLSGIETTPLSYTEGNPAIPITSTVVITDADHATMSGARIKIGTNYQNGADLLSFANTATITATWDSASGTLVLSGVDTVANYRTALRNVRYRNTSSTPSTLNRTILMLVNDGVINSNVISRSISVTAVP